MGIPLKYNFRNIAVRRLSTAMTALGIGLVVAVFVVIMSIAAGLQKSLVSTGEPLNLIVLRQGAPADTGSVVQRSALQTLKYLAGVARDEQGEPLVSPEVLVLLNLPKFGMETGANVSVRGLGPQGMRLRPAAKLLEGRMFRPGFRELTVAKKISERFQNCSMGSRIHFGKSEWAVVGLFEAGGTAFDSEIWTDVNELAQDFDRKDYNSVLLRATDETAVLNLLEQIELDQRLHLKPRREADYYREQTISAAPVVGLGMLMAALMSIGAIFAAMNTMYAQVLSRVREIGTLRVLGFTRKKVLGSLVVESVMISLVGGLIGILLALPMHGFSSGTINFRTFSEATFNFRITPGLMLGGMGFALLLGLFGGLLPAWNASRRRVVDSLREP